MPNDLNFNIIEIDSFIGDSKAAEANINEINKINWKKIIILMKECISFEENSLLDKYDTWTEIRYKKKTAVADEFT